jgi:hypothetical protein
MFYVGWIWAQTARSEKATRLYKELKQLRLHIYNIELLRFQYTEKVDGVINSLRTDIELARRECRRLRSLLDYDDGDEDEDDDEEE